MLRQTMFRAVSFSPHALAVRCDCAKHDGAGRAVVTGAMMGLHVQSVSTVRMMGSRPMPVTLYVDASPDEVLEFWFSEPVRRHWFNSTTQLDTQIRERFEILWHAAADGALTPWESSPRGALALVIVLDQLPLNMYRGRAQSFATEAHARDVAVRAIENGFEKQLSEDEQAFLFMPFMHSENLEDQERSVALYEQAGLLDNLKWARHHRELIRRFGRFPHRNAILGRVSSADELAYLRSEEAFHG